MYRTTRWFSLLGLFAITLIASSTLHAQSFGGYQYDSTFYLGAHGIPDVGAAKDSLHMTFSQIYAWRLDEFHRIITTQYGGRSTTPGAMYDTVNNRWLVSDSVQRNTDSVRKEIFVHGRNIGFKFIFAPELFSDIGYYSAKANSHYMRTDPGLFVYGVDRCEPLIGSYDWMNLKHLLGTYTVDAAAGDTACIAFRPRFMDQIMKRAHTYLYDSIGIADSSTYFNVAFTIKTDTIALNDVLHPINDTAAIAFAVLYRRVHDGQRGYDSGARYIGSIYAMVNTFKITKHMYNTGGIWKDAGDGFRTFDTSLELAQYGIVDGGGNARLNKSFFGNQDSGTSDVTTTMGYSIDSLFRRLRDTIHAIPMDSYYKDIYQPFISDWNGHIVEESDFHWRFFTTRIVPITFVSGRVAQHPLTLLERGALDTLLRKEINTFYDDPDIPSITLRLGLFDESNPTNYHTMGILSRKVQRLMREHSDSTRSVWINPQLGLDGCRILTNDLDSTSIKTVPTMVRQQYHIGISPLPITYANPDKMGITSTDTLYKWGTPDNLILTNCDSAYKVYTALIARGFGAFADYNDNGGDNLKGGSFISATARAVDVSRFKYKSRLPNDPSNPVWNVIQTLGGLDIPARSFSQWRMPTSEEIISEAWLSVGASCSGLVFGDFERSGVRAGIINSHKKTHDTEYGTAYLTFELTIPTDPAARIDSTWIGEVSRFAAVKEVCDDIHRIDSIIGWKNLEYNQNEMSLFDSRQSFATMPMLDTVKVERAVPTDIAFTAYGSPHYDPRDSAYMEITHFRLTGSNTRLSSGLSNVANGTRAILFVNRRCWPSDFQTYSETGRACEFGGALVGLGNIDVRRPVIVLKNTTGVIARCVQSLQGR